MRALVETEVTETNIDLLRTFHPAFSSSEGDLVKLLCRPDDSRAWVVFDATEPIPYTRVGGLPIHSMPTFENYPIGVLIPGGWARRDLFHHSINPRRLLSNEDLDRFRLMYPRACGARVLLSGVIQVLYPTRQAMNSDLKEYVSYKAAGIQVYFDIMDCQPSQTSIEVGQSIIADPISPKSTSCIGLRVILPDNSPAITTVTHGFVRCPGVAGFFGRTVDYLWTIKDALTRFQTVSRTRFSLPYVGPQQTPTSNTSLGKKVWLCGNAKLLGAISATFDSPSNCNPYPAGYSHDLSFISAASDRKEDQLPRVDSPAGLPKVDGWARVTEALEGKPLFITSTVAYSERDTIHGEVLDEGTRNLLQNHTKEVAAEGTQYSWDRDTLSQSVALLWRVVPDPKTVAAATTKSSKQDLDNYDRSVTGHSGSVVCLGKPTDKTVKALVFQNFQTWLSAGETTTIAGGKTFSKLVGLKGGFVLPTFLYDKCTFGSD